MSAQNDIVAAVTDLTAATAKLDGAVVQLVALNIQAPADTSALVPAVAAIVASVGKAQDAVTAEAAKITP